MDHVRDSAGSLGVDPKRLALWAFSGGGLFLAAPMRERPAWLRAVVACYPALDPQWTPEADSAIIPELLRTFSATRSLGYDALSAPPILGERVDLDNPWLNAAIDRFVETAMAKGAALDLLNHPEGRHGFDIPDDAARSRQILEHTLRFLRNHLVL